MLIVYLDQNKWIELSSFLYGKRRDRDLRDVIRFIQFSRAQKLVCFPLSCGHYQETRGHGDSARRRRLAEVMWDISEGTTLADPTVILRHELDEALLHRFPDRVHPLQMEPFNLLRQGVAGISPDPTFKIAVPESIPLKKRRIIEEMIEKSLLSGVNLFTGKEAPRAGTSEFQLRFQDALNTLPDRLERLGPEARERALYAIGLIGIKDAVSQALFRHGISWDELLALGVDGLTAFIDDLPSQRADVHLHHHWIRNKALRAERTELIDWGEMGPMTMYCDVVVTEKQFADLINRGQLLKRATVITDLLQLPGILIEKSRQQG